MGKKSHVPLTVLGKSRDVMKRIQGKGRLKTSLEAFPSIFDVYRTKGRFEVPMVRLVRQNVKLPSPLCYSAFEAVKVRDFPIIHNSGDASWFDALDLRLVAIEAELVVPDHQVTGAARLVHHLHDVIETKSLGGGLTRYGSGVSGTWIRGSDVDLTWILPVPQFKNAKSDNAVDERLRQWKIGQLQSLRKRLLEDLPEDLGLTHAEVVKSTSMCVPPVLKMGGTHVLPPCDVTINGTDGMLNTLLVKMLCLLDTRLPRLVGLLKHWVFCRNVHDRSTGGLSSYTLVIMAAAYLLESAPLRLSSAGLDQVSVDNMCTCIRGWSETSEVVSCEDNFPLTLWQNIIRRRAHVETPCDMAQLLEGFFSMFAKRIKYGGAASVAEMPFEFEIGVAGEDMDCDSIGSIDEIRQMRRQLSEQAKGAAPGVLRVLCPLTGVDVQRFATEQRWQPLLAEFERAAEALRPPAATEFAGITAEFAPEELGRNVTARLEALFTVVPRDQDTPE